MEWNGMNKCNKILIQATTWMSRKKQSLKSTTGQIYDYPYMKYLEQTNSRTTGSRVKVTKQLVEMKNREFIA